MSYRKPQATQHEAKVLTNLAPEWRSSSDIAERSDVHPRSARRHLRSAVELGIAEVWRVFPCWLYRQNQGEWPTEARSHWDEVNSLALTSSGEK